MSETWDNFDAGFRSDAASLSGASADEPVERAEFGMATGAGLGKYRILERTRTTHNAILYKARDSLLDRLVTIKQMNPGLLDDPTACGDFKREAQFLARLPKDVGFAVDIYELISDRSGLFLVEEYVEGDWLESLISKRLVNEKDALRLLRAGCIGLKALHDRKIMHRGIHPGCLTLVRPDLLRNTDLGCAAHEGDVTAPPIVFPKYAAPELLAKEDHDARVDIYSLGMVLYEIAVGRRALHDHLADLPIDPAEQAGYWRAWHLNPRRTLPPAGELNDNAPPVLSQMLSRMIEKNLERRYASVDGIIDELLRHVARRRELRRAEEAGHPRIMHVQPRALPGPQALVRPHALFAGRQPISLTWLLKPDQFTSTHPVDPVDPAEPRAEHRSRQFAGAARTSQTRVGDTIESRRPMSHAQSRLPSRPVRRQNQSPPVPPVPADIEPLPRERRGVLLPIAAALLCMIALGAAGSLLWHHTQPDPLLGQVQRKMEMARQAFDAGDYETARRAYADARIDAQSSSRHLVEGDEAALMLMLIEGEMALANNDFELVERIISSVSTSGAVTPDLSELQSRFWTKKEIVRLARESDADVKAGRTAMADLKLLEMERLARSVGFDLTALKEQIEASVRDNDYREAMSKARKALRTGDYEAALIACRDARIVRDTSDARQLNQEILDAKRRSDLVLRGDKAMLDQDYLAAEESYQAANEIEPSEDIEQKARLAGATHLFEEAREAIQRGDLLDAKRLLENSMWKHETSQAAARLSQLADAFSAARLAQNAERAMNAGDLAEAIRLFEEALPRLPSPADGPVRAKLERARELLNRR